MKRVLEIGTLIGYSAILIAKNMDPAGEFITVEINPASAVKARENIRKAGLQKNIIVVTGNTLDVIPAIPGPFDMVFIEAADSEYFAYLKLAEAKLVPDCKAKH